jgi:hypothetical protein
MIMKALILFMWFFFDFSFMCARFEWYLKSGYELKFSGDEKACMFFGWLPINANIYISSDGAEKFSIGLGLLIWALISIAVIMASLAFSLQDIESADNVCQQTTQTVLTLLVVHFISTLFCCQQSCVLLPLTSVSMNPYALNVPTDPIKAVCYHKWAVMAIPYGIPMVLGAGVGAAMAYFFASLGPLIVVALFCAGAAAMLLITAIGLFVFWLFGGFAVGMWFTFGSLNVLVDLALIKILAGPSIVLLDATSAFVSMTFGSAGCCAVLIICPSILQNFSSKRLKEYLLDNCMGGWTLASTLVNNRLNRNGRPEDSFMQALEPEMVRPC